MLPAKEHNYHVIITGTDPTARRGGIGFALPGYLSALDAAGISYEVIPTYHPTSPGGKWRLLLMSLPVLRRRIRALRREGRVIVYSHAGAGVSLLREGLLLLLSRMNGAETLLQVHAVDVAIYLRKWWKRWLFRLMIWPADRLCALTPWWKKTLSNAGIKKKISVIPNPLPKEWEERAKEPVSRSEGKGETFNILTVTRLEKGKGVDLLIKAMPFLKENIFLTMAGEGAELEEWRNLARSINAGKRVRFTGWVSGAQKQRMFDEADIFCLPTSYDSFGMSFLEAMANGLPVVALNWGPISDVVPHDRAGILVDDPDPRLIAEAIERLHDPKLCRLMGQEGKAWVLERFSAGRVGESLRKMLEQKAN